jgi:DNA-binding CsgD family transcriptional regulator
LKEKFPSLSQNDLKLCAYLKMNLSSKEMAQLMSITIRAVEVSRYRLRKKLNVSSDTNLFDYLMEAANSD